MENPRKYGKEPYRIAVVHGGPGACGEMAPVARTLSLGRGILEPLQTIHSLEGQVEELRTILEKHGFLPITLIGFSWGAWLGYIVAARYPSLIGKLILVGCGPFEEKYTESLHETRRSRLDVQERAELETIISALDDPATEKMDALVARLGTLASKTDTYSPITDGSHEIISFGGQGDIFQGVWKDAVELRRSGKLLELGRRIQCPVVAIHGDYDPHPPKGVREPLSAILKDFRFILLERCGHKPWIEREARDEFYHILREELY